MSQNKVNYSERYFNLIEEETIEYSEVTSEYQTLIDLGLRYTKNNLMIENTINENLMLNFVNSETGTQEITVSAETDYIFDDFKHNGVIQIKASDDLPTSGNMILKSW